MCNLSTELNGTKFELMADGRMLITVYENGHMATLSHTAIISDTQTGCLSGNETSGYDALIGLLQKGKTLKESTHE